MYLAIVADDFFYSLFWHETIGRQYTRARVYFFRYHSACSGLWGPSFSPRLDTRGCEAGICGSDRGLLVWWSRGTTAFFSDCWAAQEDKWQVSGIASHCRGTRHYIAHYSVVTETGSVLCRIALWDCFGEKNNFDPVTRTTSRIPFFCGRRGGVDFVPFDASCGGQWTLDNVHASFPISFSWIFGTGWVLYDYLGATLSWNSHVLREKP